MNDAAAKPVIDVAKLNQKGGVEFDQASIDELVNWVEIWDYEEREVHPHEKRRYLATKALSEGAAALGYKFRPVEFDWANEEFRLRHWKRFKLGLLASQIEEVWRRCGGKGAAGRTDKLGHDWSGPVTELMLELMRQLHIKLVPRATIRDAMKKWKKEMAANR